MSNQKTLHEQLLSLQNRLYCYAMSMTENREDAKDLLQETSLRVLDNQDKFEDNTNFKAWVFTLMRNIFINNYRKLVREQKLLYNTDDCPHLLSGSESGFISPESSLSLKNIKMVINKLERDIRLPFSLYTIGYKYQEIADKLHIPIGTVKSRIFQARKQIMLELRDR